MSAFKTVDKNSFGYSQSEVDAFILLAREQYNNFLPSVLDWRNITSQEFSLEKGGYDIPAVDVAIDKLQDTFAARELSRKSNPFAQGLSESVILELRSLLLRRASRPNRRKFSRAGVFGSGYSRKDVDSLLSIVQLCLEGDGPLTLEQVRTLSFRIKRGGYIEAQVDTYVDRLVEYLQTIRFGEPATSGPIASNGFNGASANKPEQSAEPLSPYREYP